jgi:hypothetical protein
MYFLNNKRGNLTLITFFETAYCGLATERVSLYGMFSLGEVGCQA